MSLFSDAMTVALSAIFGLVLTLVLQYYEHVKVVSKEYEDAKEVVSTTVLAFRDELQQQSQQLGDINNEIEVLKFIKANQQAGHIDEVISDLEKLKGRLLQIESTAELSAQELKELKESLEGLSKIQMEMKTQVETLDERYRGLLPETEARQVAPIVSNAILSHLHPTERGILHMLLTEGPKPATEIQQRIGKTREHAARLMRKLYDQGLVLREEDRRPYIYTVSEKVRELLREPAGEGKASETANQQG